MTQAINLANFANNLDSSGGVAPSALNAAVPLTKGGTNATTVSAARTNLGLAIGTDIPSTTGTGATGTWNINITGSATSATSATSAASASFTPVLQTTNFTVEQVGTSLIFKYNSVNIASISSTGIISSLAV